MKPFCEIIVTDVLPALRALISKELAETYGFNQTEISKKLGITQPAISQYTRELRGYRVKLLRSNKKTMKAIKDLSKKIASGKVKPLEAHKKFCDICMTVRREKIICRLHEKIYPAMISCRTCLR